MDRRNEPFPNDKAALKRLFLVLNRAGKDWKTPPREWTAAKAQMAVMCQSAA